MENVEIESLFGTVPHFVDDVILDAGIEAKKWPFRKLFSWSCSGSGNIVNISGTQHPDYIGMTWREFLRKGRRMGSNIKEYKQNPAYYTDSGFIRQPGMYIKFIDGKGYVGDDGNHRTCIGKFFLYSHPSPYMHGLDFTEQLTDERMYALYTRLVKLLPGYCLPLPEAVEIKRDDGKGWCAQHFDVRVRITNKRRNDYEGVFTADELEDGLLPAMRNPLKARFGEYRNLLF
jgi:hypothetical protein